MSRRRLLYIMDVSKTFLVFMMSQRRFFFFVFYEFLEDVFCMSLMSQRRIWYFMNISKTYVLYLLMTERCVWYIIDVLKTPCRCFKYLKDHFIVSFENCTLKTSLKPFLFINCELIKMLKNVFCFYFSGIKNYKSIEIIIKFATHSILGKHFH